jgi:hypothetical protein
MSPFVLSDADLATTELGRKRRETATVGDAHDLHVAELFAEYRDALAAGRSDLVNLIRDHAYAIDPTLVDELDGFDYPAAA